MMQNLNRKNSFEDYGAEPSPLVWEKIEKRLPPPKNKKRIWFAWSAAAILVTGLFLSAYFFDIEITLKKRQTTDKTSAPSSKETSPGVNNSKEKNQKQNPETNKHNSVIEKEKENQAVANADKTHSSEKENQAVTASTINHSSEKEKNIEPVTAYKEQGKLKTNTRKENKIHVAPNETAITEKTKEEINTVQTDESVVALNQTPRDENQLIENISALSLAMVPGSVDSLQMLRASLIDFQPLKKNYSVSRWQWSASGGQNYNYRALNLSPSANSAMSEDEKNHLSENERGIQTFAFETELGYSFSTHFNLNFGIHYFTAGQERTQSEIVFSSGVAGTSATQYSVSTSVGVLTANGTQVDVAVLNKNDTSLFPGNYNTANAAAIMDSSTTQSFTMRQEFSFIGFPLIVQYQPAEHRFTPFVGLGFSAGYLVKERVTMNDEDINYTYLRTTNDIIFFAEAQAGVKYRISHHLFFKVQPSLRYGLNSLNGDENVKWIPYSTGIGAGFNLKF